MYLLKIYVCIHVRAFTHVLCVTHMQFGSCMVTQGAFLCYPQQQALLVDLTFTDVLFCMCNMLLSNDDHHRFGVVYNIYSKYLFNYQAHNINYLISASVMHASCMATLKHFYIS